MFLICRKSRSFQVNLQVKLICSVYSQDQCVIVAVKRDEAFLWELIPKMEYFYFKFFVPALF